MSGLLWWYRAYEEDVEEKLDALIAGGPDPERGVGGVLSVYGVSEQDLQVYQVSRFVQVKVVFLCTWVRGIWSMSATTYRALGSPPSVRNVQCIRPVPLTLPPGIRLLVLQVS